MTPPRRRTVLDIDGMHAVHAVRAVEFALASLPAVRHLDVTLGSAVVDHDGSLDEAAFREALALAGCELRALRAMRPPLPVAGDGTD